MRETTATSLGASPCLHNGNRKAPKLLSWGLFVCLSAIAFAIDSIAQVPAEMQVICSYRLGAVFFMSVLRRLFLTFLDRLHVFLQCNHIIAVCL